MFRYDTMDKPSPRQVLERLDTYYSQLFPFAQLRPFLEPSIDERTWGFEQFDENDRLEMRRNMIAFSDWETFESAVRTSLPVRMHFGARRSPVPCIDPYYAYLDQTGSSSKARGLKREFVIDIDLHDYDDVRTCCSQKQVCEVCWQSIAAPLAASLYVAMSEIFAMCPQKATFVFSGRRGFHVIVPSLILDNAEEHQRLLESLSRQITQDIFSYGLRYDVNASCEMNHLLKVPYSYHYDSGNVSIAFDPLATPSLADLTVPLESLVNGDTTTLHKFSCSLKHIEF